MKRKIILHVINSLGTGGAEVLLRDTVTSLTQFEHIICYLHSPDELVNSFVPHPVYKVYHESWNDFNNTVSKIKSIIDIHQVDIVHTHLFDATLLSRLAVSNNVKFFFTIHNILSKDAFEVNRLSKMAEQFTYRKNQFIISVSQEVLKDYEKHIGIKGGSFVLYNYVHQKFFDLVYDEDQSTQNGFRLVAVGNLRKQKNYPLLLEAFRMLKNDPVTLDIYGSGEQEFELNNYIELHGLKVRLMGRVEDVSLVLPQYHAYIMASLFEGFGIAPMEAMAAGMPVILSDLPVFRELAEDIPEYFDPSDAGSIVASIRKVFANWTFYKENARKGKEAIRGKASREVYFKKLVEIYHYGEPA